MNLTCLQCETAYEIAEGADIAKAVCPQCKTPPSNFFIYSRNVEFERVDDVKPITVHESTAAAPTQPYAPGQIPAPERIGRYEILGRAGAGGMGVVYRARDGELNRTVALKVMIAGEHATEETIGRFQREARSAAKLSHPAIVRVYDVGHVPPDRPGGAPIYYFAMEFVDGTSIDKVARDPGLSPRESARIARDVARALQYAHEQGIVHRDVKPGNILIDGKRQPHLVDFGLAKEAGDSQTLTKTGDIIGTACYMPPEQASGDMRAVDERSDIYALGTVLYEMLSRRPPFIGETMARILRDVEERDPEPPSHFNPTIPRELETICLKAMAKEKDRRYGSARDFADDLDRHLSGEPIMARRTALATRASKWARRHPAAITAILMLAAFATLAAVVWFNMPPPPPPPLPPGPSPMELLAKAEPHYKRAKGDYDKARKYKNAQDRKQRITVYTHALEEVDRALGVYSMYPEAFALRGSIRVALNQLAAALADFDQALKLKPTLSEAYYERVLLRLAILQQNVTRISPFERSEEVLEREKPLVQADIEKMRQLQIHPAQALVAEARYALFFRESGANPLDLADQALEIDPTLADAYVLRAQLRYNDALAMRQNGDRTRSAQYLQEAIDDCSRAIDEDANHREAYKVRADVYLALGRRAEGIRDLDEMVSVAPDHAQSYVDRVMVFLPQFAQRRTRVRILADLKRALELDPNHARAIFFHATIRIVSGELSGDPKAIAECRDQFARVVARNPLELDAHLFRLACDLALNDEATFKEHLAELHRARPDATEKQTNGWHSNIQTISQLLKHPPKLNKYEEQLDRADRLAGEDKLAEAEHELTDVLRRLDDPVDMSQERLPPQAQRRLRASAHYQLACVHAARRDAEKALAALEEALKNGRRAEELEFDPSLEAVRSRPEFRDLIARYRRQ